MAQRGGRPAGPTDQTSDQVLRAAFQLLCSEGPASLTPVRIHQETGVARTTVYRHWPTPADIVEAILTRAVARHEPDLLNGELEHDLAITLGSLVTRLEDGPVDRLYDAIRLHQDTKDSTAASEQYIRGLLAPVRDVLAGAVDDGDLAGPDVDQLVAELCGPLLFDRLLLRKKIAPEATGQAVERFLSARR